MGQGDLVIASAIAKALEEDRARRRVFRESISEFLPIPSQERIDDMIDRRVAFESRMRGQLAELECEHGTCPGDERPQTPDCHCHGHGVAVPVPALALVPPLVAGPVRGTKHTHADGLQHFTCEVCGVEWTRPKQTGQPPRTCPEHRPTRRRAA